MMVRESEGSLTMFLMHELKGEEQLRWMEGHRSKYKASHYMTLGEFLVFEATDCVRAYDKIRDGKRPPPRKSISYPP